MIMVKFGGYTLKDKAHLRDVLSTGLIANTPDCTGRCDECEMRKVCTDINLVLHHLENVINTPE